MILTNEIIEKGKSKFGAWSRNQLAVLGVAWPPVQGWRQRITGKDFHFEDIEKFLALKDAHLKKKTAQQQFKQHVRGAKRKRKRSQNIDRQMDYAIANDKS